MNNIVDALMNQFSGEITNQISNQIGADASQTQSALSQFIPIMTKALANNSQNQGGASALFNAISKDHSGGLLNNIGNLITGASNANGSGILGHVFASKLNPVHGFITKTTGLNPQATSKLMEVAAPIVMGFLGKEKQQNNLDQNGLASILQNSTQQVQQTDPKNMGLIGSLLDRDGDGQVMDNVASMGASLLKNWMSGRRN